MSKGKKDEKTKRRKDRKERGVSAEKKKVKRAKLAGDDPTQMETATSLEPMGVTLDEFTPSSPRPIVQSSALADEVKDQAKRDKSVSLLLFYQYMEPPWDEPSYEEVLKVAERIGNDMKVTGRMRVAREGFNCTLTTISTPETSSVDTILQFCKALRQWKPALFCKTEFKVTHDLPRAQAFPALKVIPVVELVHYGLDGSKAPPIERYGGTHLEPLDYHKKISQPNTVIIDVRNHYEATIGHFQPPTESASDTSGKTNQKPAKYLDPLMRKSTEFPAWLNSAETQNELKGKQVLMFCTGGIRCERASALLKYKMETDPVVRDLGIKGVYQLQGGIDKYFKEFPDGGHWKGKNYVFDKRFAHAPVQKEAEAHGHRELDEGQQKQNQNDIQSQCQACDRAWDKYRGKRRCPTCGVPSLICRSCLERNPKISVRCDLCIQQNIRSKQDWRKKEQKMIQDYETQSRVRGVLEPEVKPQATLNTKEEPSFSLPTDVSTRLYLKNMCRQSMTTEILVNMFPGITHVVWRTDRKTGKFLGQGWVEMKSLEKAAAAVARSGERVLGRPIYIVYQKADGKDMWPPPNSAV